MIGQPINRVDGPLKVTGQATYAYEHWEAGQPLYGFIVGATIGRGRITRIDTSRAEQSPGVRTGDDHRNAPAQGAPDPSVPSQYWRAQPVLTGPEIRHYGEPVALVVAATFEQARAAAKLVDVEYAVEPGQLRLRGAARTRRTRRKLVNAGLAAETAVGDFDTGFSSAAVKIDQRYTTPYQFSQPMEPHACLAVPRGDDLIIYVSAQIVDAARTSIASTLRMDPQRIQVDRAVCRRGLRLQAGHPFRNDPGGDRRAPVEAAGQGRADAAADLPPHGPAPGDEPAGAPGRRAGRAAGRDRPRGQHVYEPARGVRRADGRHDARPVRRAQPADAATG